MRLPRIGYVAAAEASGVSVRTIRRAVASGELRAYRCGRRVLIAQADLEGWLDAMPLVRDDAA